MILRLSLLLLAGSLSLWASAQHVVVEESLTEVKCTSATRATTHYKTVLTILDEQGASEAGFACSCSPEDVLSHFRGQVTDASGRVIRKLKEKDLQRSEYSSYLAVDDYVLYLDYTPPTYPVTISYEWTVTSHDNLLEFPRFCPQDDYDVSVKHALYRLTAPSDVTIAYALQNVPQTAVRISDDGKGQQEYVLEVNDLPAIASEPFARPLRERLPMGYFKPVDFVYYGTKGNSATWQDMGRWYHGLLDGRDVLPDALRAQIHALTDTLPTDRLKVERLYRYLADNTRYVAVLLGIGGIQPAKAASVAKSGFGDCKGLSNFMRALLKEIGIPSVYTTISTVNRRLMADYPNFGQMNHAILQVPLPGDTLWLECTNPSLPLGYVHEDIAGHDAFLIDDRGGRLVRLPACPDSANTMETVTSIVLDPSGRADMQLRVVARQQQYEELRPLLRMKREDQLQSLHRIVHAPQPVIDSLLLREDGAAIQLETRIRSNQWANVSGQRLFVPLCPVHQGYSAPSVRGQRTEDVVISYGYLDTDSIVFQIPEGYVVEARPKDILLQCPFGSFSWQIAASGRILTVRSRMLMKSGTYDKALYPDLVSFIKAADRAYGQKVVLRKE